MDRGNISLFDVNSGEESRRISVSMTTVENMSFSADDSALICYSSLDQSIVTYDIETGKQISMLKFENINPALNISLAAGFGLGALSVDGQQLASFDSNNNSIRIDDLNEKQMTHNLRLEKGLSFMPGSLVLDSHNNRVGAILADITEKGRTARPRTLYMIVWDLNSGKQLSKVDVGLFVVNSHLWTLLGAERIISAFHGDITRWDLEQLIEQ
jgi:WD40 repeat protein